MSKIVIFLDDGGVMNDSLQRGPQWRQLIGEFFVPLLGGTPETWSEANRIFTEHLFDVANWRARIQAASDYANFYRTYHLDWLRGMCKLLSIPTPAEEECLELAHRAEAYIIPRVRSAFPGVVEAIRTLHGEGYTLYTASGEPSSDLAGYLDGMGVRDCFTCLYGPDLINTFKEGPEYYERIFADSGIAPSDALIVDDSPLAISWAAQVGALTVLVGNTPLPETSATLCIGSLAELPAVIQQLEQGDVALPTS